MPITIACRSCHAPLFLRPENLGKAVRCPTCHGSFVATRADILIADESAAAPAKVAPQTARSGNRAIQTTPSARRTPVAQVVCPSCQRPMLDDGSLAGQTVECVHCREPLRMPQRRRMPSATRLSDPRPQSPTKGAYIVGGVIVALMMSVMAALLVVQQLAPGRQVANMAAPDKSLDQPGLEQAETISNAAGAASLPSVSLGAPRDTVAPVAQVALPVPAASPEASSAPASVSAPSGTDPKLAQASLPASGTPVVASTAQPSTIQQTVDLVDHSIVRISIPGMGLGSGFILDEKGTVITNYHVIEGATKATVVFSDKTQVDVLGFTAVLPEMDLAALQIKPPRVLRALPLVATRPAKGEQVLAFGAPQGLSFSVSDGIVSAVRAGKEVQDVLKETTGRDVYRLDLGYSLNMTWIQTSAPISPGNSGGPLVNLAGEVVGINTWSRSGENLNFAIAAEQIAVLLRQATVSAQPFSRLPKPRAQNHQVTKSQADRTLQYWDKIYDAYQAMAASAKKEKKSSTDAASWRNKAARMRRFAQSVKKLDVREVDLELVLFATKFAQSVEDLATTLEEGASSLPRGRLDSRTARSTSYRSAYIRYRFAASQTKRYCQSFDLLRIGFSTVYGLDFRAIFQDDEELGDGLTEGKKPST